MPTAEERDRVRKLIANFKATDNASLSKEDYRFLVDFNLACRARRESIQSFVNLVLFVGLGIALYAAFR